MKCETNLRDGFKKIEETKRPGMVIIHRSTCSACTSLRAKLLASKEIDRLSNNFVVISLMDEEEPKEAKWLPDGKYFPRVLFLNSGGQIMRDVVNSAGGKFKYYYSSEASLLKSMNRVLNSIREAQ